MPVRYVETSRLPTAWGVFDIHGFEDPDSNKEHIVLTMGDVGSGDPVLAAGPFSTCARKAVVLAC